MIGINQGLSTMHARTRYTRFAGIDVAKNKHVCCIIDADGHRLVRSESILNTAAGYQQLLTRLAQHGGPAKVLLGMEATGHYWYSLHDFLTRHGYHVAVLNPIQTAQQAKKGIRKAKTDTIDAFHIAVLLKNGEYRPALVPGELAMTCRQLTRLRYSLVRQTSRIKQLIWSRLQPAWPEYEALFAQPFGSTGRKLLAAAPTPADLLALPASELAEMIAKVSRRQFGADKVAEIRTAAEQSIGVQRGLEGIRIGIRSLLSQLDALRPIRQELEGEIIALAGQLPGYVLSLPAATPLAAVSLFGETDPIQTFATSSQLVAFAGLDLVVYQTGEYDAPRRHISKRGSPVLRHTLWSMAHWATRSDNHLRTYFLRRRADGLPHRSAVTACAIKLCHIVWRILTDQRPYDPAGRPAHS